MVCEKCQKKLSKVIVPDKWKEGASNTTESGGLKVNENKLLSKKHRWTPYGNTKCIICKQQVHQDAKYCHTCAYSKGLNLAISLFFHDVLCACGLSQGAFHVVQAYARCAVSKCSTPSFTSRVTYNRRGI
ncbi:hypothetical protein PVK06_021940 [Gossypium arboreum]|uniref:Cysteine-rich PDZ-binding protein n=1 Tax=Gossypium arboreum TaxID=29729 RepID=A0ABR0PRT4_GOSAR|nr:hypothetical protein PVK06_021940 [Gossypium arboreum]